MKSLRKASLLPMTSIVFLFAGILLTASLSECGPETWVISTPICEVERILMHEGGVFTFFVREPGTNNLYTLPFNCNYGYRHYKFITDVPSDKKSWLDIKCIVSSMDEVKKTSFFRDFDTLDIHIHSAIEINGAGWVHGGNTTTRGQTIVVE